MKPNQLKLPFGQGVKPTQRTTTETVSSSITIPELEVHGSATATALSPEIILELGKRYDQEAYPAYGTLQSPTDVYNTFRDEMKDLPVTTYKVIAVNMKHVVTVTKVFDSLPTIKQIMRWAVSNSAAALFVCRNTSGTPTIPYEEERFMVDLADAGDVVGIDLLDYLVLDATCYMSGRVEGLL